MARPYTLAGIDIGNTQIKAVIAAVNRETLTPDIVGGGAALSHGLRRGMVVDMEETIENIRAAVQRAEAMAGTPLKRAYLSVSGLHIKTQISKGVIAVSRADSEISQSDIERVIHAASVVSLPPNREVIHVIPRTFIVDGSEYVKNPLGMKGVRLEVDVLIIEGLSPHIRNIVKCVNECGIEVAGLVYAPLAASWAALDKGQKEYGVMNLDFGGGTSSMTIFEEADLVHSALFPIGSRHITNDLAIALRTSLDVAERVKLEHGALSGTEDLRKRETIDLSQMLGEEDFILPKKQLLRIIDARAHEMLDMVNDELKRVEKHGTLPAGVVLTGGGINLPGFPALVKEKLRLPVRVAHPQHLRGIPDIVTDPSYAVAVGLIAWGIEQDIAVGRSRPSTFSTQNGFLGRVIGWLKNFMP